MKYNNYLNLIYDNIDTINKIFKSEIFFINDITYLIKNLDY